MPFVEGGIVVDAEQPQQQAAPQAARGGFVEGGITVDAEPQQQSQGGFVKGGITADPTPDDSYNMVLQYNAAQTDYVPSKQDFLDYLKVSKTKPLLGEKPMETIGTAAVQTVEDIASMPYKLGEAIGQYMDPPEGVTPMQVAGGTAAEIAVQSRLKAENMGRGLIDTALNKLSDITGKLRNDDDKYEAFLAAAEIKRQLARANAPGDQRVPASQDVLQAYGIPEEAISQQGLDVGGFLADPSSIAFAGGGKLASALAQRAIPLIPRAGQILQRAGERISNLGRVPENMAGRFTAGVTGSEQMGQAVQEGIARGATGISVGEAAGLPITVNVPGLGTAANVISGTKGLGAAMETVGEAGAVSGGQRLTATQRGLLGTGERIAAAEGASSRARALGTALARSGLETPIRGAATILLPMAGGAAGGAALAGLTGEEGDAIASAIGSGAGFGAFDGGFKLAKTVEANVFNGARVRQTAVDDLNTRPTDVQFTYIDPVAGEQIATIKDSEARATLYGRLNNKQLVKALSEVAGAEGAGIEVIFHTDSDTVPAGLQTVNYAGVSIGPDNVKSGKPTVLINVDKASPDTLPHEILHARITQAIKDMLSGKVISTSSQDPDFKRQFTDFSNAYADKLESRGGRVIADRIRIELRDAFDPALERAQQVKALNVITDEFAAYYTQEMLKGKDPKTMLPGRIPSFFEMALNNAKEAVSERFTRRALQAGFDPVARTFYDANGRRIKLDWMEDAIKNLVTPKEGYEPTEQRVDINKMTQAQQNAVIMARGYSDLFMTAPDGSIVRPLSKAELEAKTADIANRTMRVVESVPQAERTSISGMDAYGNPVIEGRFSLAEADAVSKSGIFGPSSSRTLIDIATAIRDGTLMEGSYWKVYGSTGRSGVFGESQKLFLPYGISINSKGGVNVKVVDWGKVQARMYKALSKPAYKSLFNNYDQAMSTMRDVYLKNIAETGAVPSAEALGGGIEGAKKRNMFNEIMGAVPRKGDVMVNFPTAGYVANRKGGSVYQDLRLERIQNADSTKAQIPWTGDMGEQSSYRRTQLNFMPAEAIGETRVSTDENGGYRILSKNGKFRLYGPDGSTVGIFDTQEQARLKAEKDYATQTRLQPSSGERFMPASDTDYLSAVKKGDTATAHRMVDEVANAAGYTVGPVFHRTSAKNINVFRPWVNFGTEEQSSNVDLTGRVEGDTRTYQAFLNLSNPIRVRDEGMAASNVLQQAREQGVVSGEEMANFPYNRGDDVERAYVAKVLEKNGFDGIVYENEYEGQGDSYIALKPSQIKSADPITKDNAGNVIPLSQRFKATSEDIRYMPGEATIYRAGDKSETGVKAFSSWSENKSTAEAYLDNPGFGGAVLRSEKVPLNSVLDADTTNRKGMERLARQLGFDAGTGDEWFDNGWKYPWEESKSVKEALKKSGFDAIRYPDDFPEGVTSIVPLKDFAGSENNRFMPSPDSAMPGAYSFPGGYRALPGKAKGSLRLYGPAGSLVGIASSLDEAQRILRRKNK